MARRGKYIVIEGHDGTGKSTQVELLAKQLLADGKSCFIVHEPAGTPIADEIRTIIKNGHLERDGLTNLLLFTAARHEIWKQAEKHLEAGEYVLSARNYLSTLAYQGYGEGISLDLIKQMTREFTSERYMNPDVTLILTLENDSRLERLEQRTQMETPENPDAFEEKSDDFQQRVTDGYLEIARKYNYPTSDARQTIEAINLSIRGLAGIDEAET